MMTVYFFSLLPQAAFCSAYVRIIKSCAPHIWRLESLFDMICSSKPFLPLTECFQAALSSLVPDLCTEVTKSNSSLDLSHLPNNKFEVLRVGEKRSSQAPEVLKAKRHKKNEVFVECTSDFQDMGKLNYINSERKQEYANYLRSSLVLFLERLQPPDDKASSLEPDVALMALSTLCIVFCGYVHTELSRCILVHMRGWISWVCRQVGNYAN